MSFLRYLSPAHRSRPSSPSPSGSRASSRTRKAKALQPRLEIHLPSYGSLFMPQTQAEIPETEEAGPSRPRKDIANRGELVVEIPIGMGRRKIKFIRVGTRSFVELDMGPGRGWEKDIIFDRKVEIGADGQCTGKGTLEKVRVTLESDGEGIILEEGITRFGFTLYIPSDLPGHDRHANGKIEHCIYADLEGIPPKDKPKIKAPEPKKRSSTLKSPSSPNGAATPSQPASRGSDNAAGPSTPPTPDSGVNPASLTSALTEMSIQSSGVTGLPTLPGYQEARVTDQDVEWWVGVVSQKRYSEVLHNIEPTGGILQLDVKLEGAAEGLGAYRFVLLSDAWTPGALLSGTLSLPAPSPKATIYSFRVLLSQTHETKSPRDDPLDPPIATTQVWPIFETGTRPATTDKHPAVGVPALWRGAEAGGKSPGEFIVEGLGRNPDDAKARPTTPESAPSPITVRHKLIIEVQFSIWGEDHLGNKLEQDGPGRTRALVLTKPTELASCAFTPEELRLPTYGSNWHQDAFSHLARRCPLCGLDPPDKVCKTCPPSSIPHARHDLDPKLVGNEDGHCPLCAVEVVPIRASTFEDCACGMSTEYLIERLKGKPWGDAGQAAPVRMKADEVERGRRR